MELTKSNAFPSLASNLVLGVHLLYERSRAHKLQGFVLGVVSTIGCWGSARNIPLAGSV